MDLPATNFDIATCERHIAEQRFRLTSIMRSGRDAEDSETLPGNLVGSLGALHHLRKIMIGEMGEARTRSVEALAGGATYVALRSDFKVIKKLECQSLKL